MWRKTKAFYLQWPLSFMQSRPSLRHSGSKQSLSHDPSPNLSLHFLMTGHRPHGSSDTAADTNTETDRSVSKLKCCYCGSAETCSGRWRPPRVWFCFFLLPNACWLYALLGFSVSYCRVLDITHLASKAKYPLLQFVFSPLESCTVIKPNMQTVFIKCFIAAAAQPLVQTPHCFTALAAIHNNAGQATKGWSWYGPLKGTGNWADINRKLPGETNSNRKWSGPGTW